MTTRFHYALGQRGLIVWLVLCILGSPLSYAGSGAEFGAISYPAFGNLNAKAGTLLVMFRWDEPTPPVADAWYQPDHTAWIRFMIATLQPQVDHSLSIFVRPTKSGSALWTRADLAAFGPDTPNLNGGGTTWKTGERHVVAYTWDAEGTHTLWADGEAVESRRSAAMMSGIGPVEESPDTRIRLGSSVSGHSSMLTVYAVHVLDIALDTEHMAAPVERLFAAQPRSLLLDRFDHQDFEPDGAMSTRAQVITGFTGERGGIPSRACRFVDTKFGRGLQLYRAPE